MFNGNGTLLLLFMLRKQMWNYFFIFPVLDLVAHEHTQS